jgi:hypothetical protein
MSKRSVVRHPVVGDILNVKIDGVWTPRVVTEAVGGHLGFASDMHDGRPFIVVPLESDDWSWVRSGILPAKGDIVELFDGQGWKLRTYQGLLLKEEDEGIWWRWPLARAKAPTVITTTTVIKECTCCFSAKELRQLAGAPDNASVTIYVPGGGDWSNADLNVSESPNDEQAIVVRWKTEKKS